VPAVLRSYRGTGAWSPTAGAFVLSPLQEYPKWLCPSRRPVFSWAPFHIGRPAPYGCRLSARRTLLPLACRLRPSFAVHLRLHAVMARAAMPSSISPLGRNPAYGPGGTPARKGPSRDDRCRAASPLPSSRFGVAATSPCFLSAVDRHLARGEPEVLCSSHRSKRWPLRPMLALHLVHSHPPSCLGRAAAGGAAPPVHMAA